MADEPAEFLAAEKTSPLPPTFCLKCFLLPIKRVALELNVFFFSFASSIDGVT